MILHNTQISLLQQHAHYSLLNGITKLLDQFAINDIDIQFITESVYTSISKWG